MKKKIYKEISTNSRNKKYDLKNKLTSLADKAKNRINNNKILRELIFIIKSQIAQNKEKFLKYSTIKLMSKNNRELLNSINKEINTNNTNIQSENDSLKKIICALQIKYDTMITKVREISDNYINNYEREKEKNFLIKNALKSKENNFLDISKNILKIKSENNKLEVDYAVYYEKELEEEIDVKNELKKNLEFFTLLCDQKLVKINKFINNSKKKSKIIDHLKIVKKKIKKYIKTLNNLLTNFDCLSFPDDKNIIIEGEECLREINDYDGENNMNTLAVSLTEESESILNETNDIMTSDIKEFEFIRNIYIEDKTKIITTSTIPKLDLALINFNKQKLNYDYDEKSLSRNDMKEHGFLSLRIIKLKEEIKALKDKNEKLMEKIRKYTEKINKLDKYYMNINYQNPNTYRIKSVKKRKFLFNSTTTFSNSNISKTSQALSYRIDISRNKNKLNLNNIE